MMRRVFGFFLGSFLLTMASSANADFSQLNQIDNSAHQVIVVDGLSGFQAEVNAFEKKNGVWRKVLGPLVAVVGRNGIAPAGEKREGDGRAPSGTFDIKRAFGYAPHVDTGLAYAHVTDKDLWVDDPQSPQYNQWVQAPTEAKSFENLRRKDDLYKLAAVIEYNTSPIIPGHGSAIFLHIWRGSDEPTSGCVALKERDVRRLLKWLDRDKNPQIVIQKQ